VSADVVVTQTITITREIREGSDTVAVQWDETAPFIEILGMVEIAKATLMDAYSGNLPPDAVDDRDES